LSERAGRAGSTLSKNIFSRVLGYLNVPLTVDIAQRMREVPCSSTADDEEFINETILIGESRMDGATNKLPPLNEPNVERELSRLL